MIFMILAASNALDGTLAPYRPPTFQFWAPGVWARGTWGMNDEWDAASGGGPTATGDFGRRRMGAFIKRGGVGSLRRGGR